MPPYLAFQLWYEASDIPASRQTFLTVRPASTDFRTVMIWCSVKRDTYILTASVNGFIVANASDNNVDWAKVALYPSPFRQKQATLSIQVLMLLRDVPQVYLILWDISNYK